MAFGCRMRTSRRRTSERYHPNLRFTTKSGVRSPLADGRGDDSLDFRLGNRACYCRLAMRDALHEYLLERPGGATPSELLDLIFTQPAADREFGPRFLDLLLSPDRRFAFRREQGRWIATMHEALQRELIESSFVVVDIETTGGAPGARRPFASSRDRRGAARRRRIVAPFRRWSTRSAAFRRSSPG